MRLHAAGSLRGALNEVIASYRDARVEAVYGPSGLLRDLTGDYQLALHAFVLLSGLSVLAALAARAPAIPTAPGGRS